MPEGKWIVVWYDCCEDPDMDDEGSYVVRIDGDALNKLYLDFKYVTFPYNGIVDQWKRQTWTGMGVSLDTPTSLLQDYYGDGKTITDIPDITEHVIETAVNDIKNTIAYHQRDLDKINQYKEELCRCQKET